jgi:hypothetical protein
MGLELFLDGSMTISSDKRDQQIVWSKGSDTFTSSLGDKGEQCFYRFLDFNRCRAS